MNTNRKGACTSKLLDALFQEAIRTKVMMRECLYTLSIKLHRTTTKLLNT